MAYKIEVNSLIKESFEVYKPLWKTFLAIMAVFAVFGAMFNYLTAPAMGSAAFINSLILMLPALILGAGMIRYALAVVDGKPCAFADIFKAYDVIVPFFLVSAGYNAAVFLGTLLLIVPGVILSVRLLFATYVVIDGKAGVVDAFKMSFEKTKGLFWDISLLFVALIGVNIVGVLALGVGLLVTLPVTIIAMAKVYRGIFRS